MGSRKLVAVMALVALVAACGGTTASSAPSLASPIAIASSSPAVSAPPSATTKPTPTPLPTALARPTDIPTDGTCEAGFTCLGLLTAGKHHTKVIKPGFAFTLPSAGWENLSDEGGVFALLPIDTPGDGIFFFVGPRPLDPDGSRVGGIPTTVKAFDGWLTTQPGIAATKPAAVSVGGLKGERFDVTIAPDATDHPADCPTVACVTFMRGDDPSNTPAWQWDWGVASGERMRLYVLQNKDDLVAIVVDSLDGTTFEAITKAADQILPSVRFET